MSDDKQNVIYDDTTKLMLPSDALITGLRLRRQLVNRIGLEVEYSVWDSNETEPLGMR